MCIRDRLGGFQGFRCYCGQIIIAQQASLLPRLLHLGGIAAGKAAAAAPAPKKVDKKAKTKATATKEEKKPNSAASVLEKAGKAAIARHSFKEVFVTSDGQAFPLRSDAQHHAADLTSKEIIKVTE